MPLLALLALALAPANQPPSPQLFADAAIGANQGVGGLADDFEAMGAVAVGGRWRHLSLAASFTRSALRPSAPEHYLYLILCPEGSGSGCSMPTLQGTSNAVDLRLRLFPFGRARLEPFAETRTGYTWFDFSDTGGFVVRGIHLGAALGLRAVLEKHFAAFGTLGYSFSHVDKPRNMIDCRCLDTSLAYIANYAHELQGSAGLEVAF